MTQYARWAEIERAVAEPRLRIRMLGELEVKVADTRLAARVRAGGVVAGVPVTQLGRRCADDRQILPQRRVPKSRVGIPGLVTDTWCVSLLAAARQARYGVISSSTS